MRKYIFQKLDSTNDFLKQKKDIMEYDLIIAETQTAGRGRRGNEWKSDKGAALFSFSLAPNRALKFEEYRKLPLITGLAVLNALRAISDLDCMFKWTNDVYTKNKKISGLLIEFTGEFFIIGIGINVNNRNLGELSHKATSLILETEKEYNIDEVIEKVIIEFKILQSRFLRGEWNLIRNEINMINYLKGKSIRVEHLGKIDRGVAGDIVEDGMLEVKLESGKIKNFDVGEIHIEF